MTSDPVLLNNVLDPLSGMGTLRQRKMFGGIYIYCDDLFIATIHDGSLYFKANAETAGEFIAKGLRIFSYPKEGGIATLQYYEAPPEVFTGRVAMNKWAAKALLAARQDAARKTKKTPPNETKRVALKKEEKKAK
jgi:DNA transformation protein